MKFNILFVILLSSLFLACNNEDDSDSNSKNPTNLNVETLIHDNETRRYIVYTPPSYTENSKMPVFINFHGYGGDAEYFFNETKMKSVADAEGFILVYPQGLNLEGYSHWNAGLVTPNNKSDVDDFGFMEAMISKLSTDYSINTDRIYANGYSNGGMFAYALACFKSDLIAATGSVSGGMLTETKDKCSPNHPTPIINFHGTSDYVLSYNGGNGIVPTEETLNYWSNYNQTSTTETIDFTNNSNTVSYKSYKDGNRNVSVDHYKVIDGGHVWFNINIDGKNTAEIIWDFVSKYDKNGEI